MPDPAGSAIIQIGCLRNRWSILAGPCRGSSRRRFDLLYPSGKRIMFGVQHRKLNGTVEPPTGEKKLRALFLCGIVVIVDNNITIEESCNVTA